MAAPTITPDITSIPESRPEAMEPPSVTPEGSTALMLEIMYSDDTTGLLTEIRDISQEQLLVHQEMRDTQYYLLFAICALAAVTLIGVFMRGWKGDN